MKNCIVLFSNADTSDKKELLHKTLKSLEVLKLPIILATHSPVNEEIQNKCDYVVYDRKNLIFKETEFFNENLPLTEANFNTQFFFGGILTRCYLHKKTYGPAVVNLYINSFRLAHTLGFDYALLWEYDFELTTKTSNFINDTFNEVKSKYSDGFFIPCHISGILSIHAVPSIIPINKFNSFLPSKVLSEPIDYVKEIKLMICEEWMFHFFLTLKNTKILSYDEYEKLVDLSLSNQVSSGLENPLFWGLNSGVFIDKNDKSNWICSIYNASPKFIEYSYEIHYKGTKIDSFSSSLSPNYWRYNFIPKHISEEILSSDEFLEVRENIKFDNTDETYYYKINKNNVDSISKGKVFFLV